MPQSMRGMSVGTGIDVVGTDIRAGCMLRVPVASDPDYGDIEELENEPTPRLTLDDIAYWRSVLDQQEELALNSRK